MKPPMEEQGQVDHPAPPEPSPGYGLPADQHGRRLARAFSRLLAVQRPIGTSRYAIATAALRAHRSGELTDEELRLLVGAED